MVFVKVSFKSFMGYGRAMEALESMGVWVLVYQRGMGKERGKCQLFRY